MPALLAFTDETRRRVVDLLLCMLFADGRVAREEIRAVRSVAISLGIPEVVEGSWSEAPRTIEHVGLEQLPRREGALAYLSAAWMALVDGIEHVNESALLRNMAERLGLDDERTAWLRERAHEARRAGGAPSHREYDSMIVNAARSLAA